MASKQVGRLVGAAIVCVLSTPLMVVGEGRKNPRDFPDGTLCPVNLGWSVDPLLGDTVEPKVLRPPLHTFTAAGTDAEISLVACDGGLTGERPGLEVWVRDFAVVRKDIYESHQAAGGYPHDPLDPFANTCYFAHGDEAGTPFARLVGSTFNSGLAPAVNPLTLKFPFFDDFSNLASSQKKWRLDGAEFKTVTLNDPRLPAFFDATALVMARDHAGAAPDFCSMARVKVRHLKKGETYVIDFQWENKGTQNVPDVQMLTFVDTNP